MSSRGNGTSNTNTTSLSPFDLSGLGMGFGIYRPRRPSYTIATQENRQRNQSYRCATRKECLDSNTSDPSGGEDFIEDVLNHRRKTSYIRATKNSSKLPVLENDQNEGKNNVTPKPELEPDANHRDRLKGDKKSKNKKDSKIKSSGRNSFSQKIRDSQRNSTDEISLTEVTIIQPVLQTELHETALRGEHETNGNLNDENSAMNPKTVERRGVYGIGAGWGRSLSNTLRFNKNLIVLSISFILIYSSFQAIQNLQSSINAPGGVGPITMMIVHIATVLSCLLAPTIINVLSAKWALCLGVLFFLAWFGSNFHPAFYSLVPTSIFIGLAQGVVWSAESSYIHKLAFDWAKISRASVDDEMFRFHGIFLACFQTTHIWGNLISSLWLSKKEEELTLAQSGFSMYGLGYPPMPGAGNLSLDGASMQDYGDMEMADMEAASYPPLSKCGALFQCEGPAPPLFPGIMGGSNVLFAEGELWKLMIFYILFGVIAFLLIIFVLDRIGARASPGKSPKEIITQHTSQLVTHPTLRLLIPLLLFNGMQQGFMYSDYNHYFVTCSLGVHYVGYCMITLGVANVMGAVFVTLFAHRIPREVILGFGGILHIALMIGYLIWIPENKPVLFCVLAGAWGVCDAIWQTQCNTLICLTCTEEPDVAFTNYRLVQSVGLAVVFGMGAWVCVSVKLYILMTLLVLSIMFYVLAEYQLRHSDDDVFES